MPSSRFSLQLLLLSFFLLPLSLPLRAQQPSPAAQAATLLQQSLAAQTGGAAINDITLTGTVTFLNSTRNESGSVTFTSLSAGTTRVVANTPSGTLTQTWSLPGTSGPPVISTTNPNGSVARPAGGSVTMPAPAWLAPALFTAIASGSTYSSSYVGAEIRNNENVQHVSIWQTSPQSAAIPPGVTIHSLPCELYLDQSTSLPASAVCSVRPQLPPGKQMTIRTPYAAEEVRYSNYQTVQGRAVPLHIQVFLGPMQAIDISISSVAINTGATIAASAN
jgi:hypothetical protein